MSYCEYIQDEGETVDLVVWEEWVRWEELANKENWEE